MQSRIISAQQESDSAHEHALDTVLQDSDNSPARWIANYKTIIANCIMTIIVAGQPYRPILFMELTADTVQGIVNIVTPTLAATATHVICRYVPGGIAFIITANTHLQYTSADAVKLYDDVSLFSKSNSRYTLADMYAIARQVLQHVCDAGVKFGTRDNRVMLDSTFAPLDVKYLMTVLRKKLRYHQASVFCQYSNGNYLIMVIFTYGLPNAFDPLNAVSTFSLDRNYRECDTPYMSMMHNNAKFRPFDF
jgi:hypothetical protein